MRVGVNIENGSKGAGVDDRRKVVTGLQSRANLSFHNRRQS
jgi:hypothetical protein